MLARLLAASPMGQVLFSIQTCQIVPACMPATQGKITGVLAILPTCRLLTSLCACTCVRVCVCVFKGVYKLADGSKYEGEWQAGVKHGVLLSRVFRCHQQRVQRLPRHVLAPL